MDLNPYIINETKKISVFVGVESWRAIIAVSAPLAIYVCAGKCIHDPFSHGKQLRWALRNQISAQRADSHTAVHRNDKLPLF